jgi:hypothetical protein
VVRLDPKDGRAPFLSPFRVGPDATGEFQVRELPDAPVLIRGEWRDLELERPPWRTEVAWAPPFAPIVLRLERPADGRPRVRAK